MPSTMNRKRWLIVFIIIFLGGCEPAKAHVTPLQEVFTEIPAIGTPVATVEMFTPVVALTPTSAMPASSSTLHGGDSRVATISANGRWVALQSEASHLVPGDTNEQPDIFVYDIETGKMTIVSVTSQGEQANKASSSPGISADGRFVVFNSLATNLVEGDRNVTWDVFLHDRETGETELISVSIEGGAGNGLSSSGMFSISADGRFVAFISDATNLVPDDTNGVTDVFVRDRWMKVTTRVNLTNSGEQASLPSFLPTISGNGRYIVFASYDSLGAENILEGLFIHDLDIGETKYLWGCDGSPMISNDGRYIAAICWGVEGFAVHLMDQETGSIEWVGVMSEARPGGPLVGSEEISLSGDGRFVAFWSISSSLLPDGVNQQQVYVYDREKKKIILVSVDEDGVPGNGDSASPSLSYDGRLVVFRSYATNLVSNDQEMCGDEKFSYNCADIFLYDRQTGVTKRISVPFTP
jgi:Tol biopolymer transport system component